MSTSAHNNADKVIRRFQCTDLKNNANKYWQVAYWNDGPNTYTTHVTFGRVGQECSRPTTKPGQTLDAIERLIRSKTGKRGEASYVEVDLHAPAAAAATAATTTTTALAPKVEQLMHWLFQNAGEAIDGYLRGRVEALSVAQLAQARSQLQVIGGEWSRYSGNPSQSNFARLEDGVQAFYNLIPTKLPSRIEPQQLVRDFCSNLNEQQSRLDQLEAALATIVAPGGGSTVQYDVLGAHIDLLPTSDNAYDRIVAFVQKRHNHHFTMRVRDIFSVDVPAISAAYATSDRGKSKVELLCHGSRSGNWRHILKQGLRLPSIVGATHGAAFGSGVYFASQATKSGQYCGTGYRTGLSTSDQYGLLLCDVAVGKQYIPRMSNSSLTPPAGYDSVWAKAGHSGVVNDEHVIFDTAQHAPRYFVTWTMA